MTEKFAMMKVTLVNMTEKYSILLVLLIRKHPTETINAITQNALFSVSVAV